MHRLSLIPTEHRRIHRPFYRATTKNAPASMCTPARDRLTQNWLALVRVACTAVVAPTWRAGASPRAAIISVTQRSICPSRTTQRSKSCCNGNETISNHYMPLCKFEYFCRGYGKKTLFPQPRHCFITEHCHEWFVHFPVLWSNTTRSTAPLQFHSFTVQPHMYRCLVADRSVSHQYSVLFMQRLEHADSSKTRENHVKSDLPTPPHIHEALMSWARIHSSLAR